MGEAAAPQMLALLRAGVRWGAHVYTSVQLDEAAETALEEASDEQLTHVAPLHWKEIESGDAFVTHWGDRDGAFLF